MIKEEKKRRRRRKRERQRKFACLGWQIIIHNFCGSAIGLINCFLHLPLGWSVQKFIVLLSRHYFQMYNAIVSKCFGKKDLERNHEVLTKIEICNKAK